MNECMFLGNLTRDPELKETASGKKVVNFSIGVNNRRSKESKEVAFIDCEAWDTGAETINKFFKKGDPIIIRATARTDSWENAEGEKRSRLRFRVNNFEFLPSKPNRPLQSENNEQETDQVDSESNTQIPF